MSVTIYDIAREAKVGIGTVSRVFNDHPSVSDETRQRVLRVANRLNYQPHPYARGLARKRTNSILTFVPFFTTFFFVEILHGVQSKLSEHDCDLLLYGVNHPDQVSASLKRNAIRGRVDGVLFFSMKMPDEFAAQYIEMKTPVVLVDTYHPSFDSFTVENVQGAYTAAKHLISLGHQKIGILNANLESVPARERLHGFQKAVKEAGLSIDPIWLKHSASPRLDGFTRETGYELMKEFIAMGSRRPTAVFVASDIQAIGALAALQDANLHCPDDVAIVGFDDIMLASSLGLTTMRQPMFEMGSLAVERLMTRMQDPVQPAVHMTFTPKLVVRSTCGFENSPNNPVSRSKSVGATS
ncbi:MAG TPA: LacI family DNA-binding transcriptional regulator [Bacteroidota bacterium]|nr:LacI family DNA-binding transcriptional regulator [Bacteroidota bacterium]